MKLLFRRVRTLLSTDAGAMGVDVDSTSLVVICSATSTTSGFQQEVAYDLKSEVIDIGLLCTDGASWEGWTTKCLHFPAREKSKIAQGNEALFQGRQGCLPEESHGRHFSVVER